jgi:phage/plasmid-like protein (TIGR03299 family)
MPHNIGEMFYVGERPWHKLGTHLSEPADMKEALKAGGLIWEVDMVPIAPVDDPNNVIRQRLAVVRRDRAPGHPGRVIGVVHPDFVPLQNVEGAQLFDSLIGQGEHVYHTGGYLKNGERVWLLARLPAEIKLNGNDVVEPYLLFSNSHDGSSGIDIRLTTIRVVCQNTLSMALGQKAEGKAFRRGHNGRYEVVKEEAQAFFKFALDQTKEAEQLFTRLAAKPCDAQAFENFLKTLMPDLKKPTSAERDIRVKRAYETKMANLLRAREQIRKVRGEGIPKRGIPPDATTWWGALNTVTAWVDHLQETQSDRYAHNLVGSGDKLKSTALALVRAAIK